MAGRNSLQAAVLVGVIWVGRALLGQQLTAGWWHAVGWVVVVRLLLPAAPSSSFSLYNLVPWPSGGEGATREGNGVAFVREGSTAAKVTGDLPRLAAESGRDAVAPMAATPDGSERRMGTAVATSLHRGSERAGSAETEREDYGKPRGMRAWMPWLAGGWLRGCRGLGGSGSGARRAVSSSIAAGGAPGECRRASAFRGMPEADGSAEEGGDRRGADGAESGGVWSVASGGIVARGHGGRTFEGIVAARFSARVGACAAGDLWANVGLAVAETLHWFNPLVWLAFARMREDREEAADARALSVAGEGEARAYGQTILRILESWGGTPAWPRLVGILEDRHPLARRIRAIASYRGSQRGAAFPLALVVLLAVTGWTEARTDRGPVPSSTADTGEAAGTVGSRTQPPLPPRDVGFFVRAVDAETHERVREFVLLVGRVPLASTDPEHHVWQPALVTNRNGVVEWREMSTQLKHGIRLAAVASGDRAGVTRKSFVRRLGQRNRRRGAAPIGAGRRGVGRGRSAQEWRARR